MEWAAETGIMAIFLLAEMNMVVISNIFLISLCILYISTIFPFHVIISCVNNVNSD